MKYFIIASNVVNYFTIKRHKGVMAQRRNGSTAQRQAGEKGRRGEGVSGRMRSEKYRRLTLIIIPICESLRDQRETKIYGCNQIPET